MRIAVIPARGGSKRIPRKNIRAFCGVPIIAYSIEAARQSGLFDRVLVSTDDEEIASIAQQFGAEVPFIRPDNLSGDYIGTAEVVLHALTEIADDEIGEVCCIYATSPFIRLRDLAEALVVIENGHADAAFPVTSYASPIFRALRIADDGYLSMFWPEHYNTRSNDLPSAFHDAGMFYWLNRENFERERKIYATRSAPLIIPRYLVNDIDAEEDWRRAELMYDLLVNAGEIAPLKS